MEFNSFHRWFHNNRGALESIILLLAERAGLECDPAKVLGGVQARLLFFALDPAYAPEFWQWMEETFRLIQAELDVLGFVPWWNQERERLEAYGQTLMKGYATRQELKDVMQDALLAMTVRLNDTSKPPIEKQGLKSYVKRVIRNIFISGYRKHKRERPLAEDFDQTDPLASSPSDSLADRELRDELRLRMAKSWRWVRLTRFERRALWYWLKADFDRQAALELMRLDARDKTEVARQYDQPLCRAKRKLFAAFSPLGTLIRELEPADAVEELKSFLLSKLSRAKQT